MNQKLLIIISIFLWSYSPLIAQINFSVVDTLEFDLFPFQVKQIDEFMQRFNGDIDVFDKKDSITRQRNLAALFNKEYVYNNDSAVIEFINDVVASDATIHYTDTTWMAIAECDAIFNKKKVVINLALKVEEQKKGVYKWSIVDASSDILQLKPLKVNDGLKIPPTNNEVDFSYLSHITTEECNNILNFASNKYQVDQLSVFFALVQQKLLKIELVKTLTYHFENVAGYTFDVSYFNREMTTNAGWLINSVRKL